MVDKTIPDDIRTGDHVKVMYGDGVEYGRVEFVSSWGMIAIVRMDQNADRTLICVTDQLIKVDESTNGRDNDRE